jgi:hypothetical protein
MPYTVRKTHPTDDAPGAPADHKKETLEEALRLAHEYIDFVGAESVIITGANCDASGTNSLLFATVTRCEHGGVTIQATYAQTTTKS